MYWERERERDIKSYSYDIISAYLFKKSIWDEFYKAMSESWTAIGDVAKSIQQDTDSLIAIGLGQGLCIN